MWTTRCWTTTASRRISATAWNSAFGAAERARYWEIFGRLRAAARASPITWGACRNFEPGSTTIRNCWTCREFLLEYPFAARLFPRALEAIAHLRTLGTPGVLSDGDIVFQPRKIQRSGIWDAVEGRVMIYVHKEKVLDHMQRRYPAKHYVMVDDKAESIGGDEVDP